MQAAQPAPSVGVLFNLAVTEFVEQNLPALDHLAVIPDRCRMDAGPGSLQRTFTLPVLLAQMNRVAGRRSAVLNGIGMSFCSADVFDRAYLDNFAHWARHWHADGVQLAGMWNTLRRWPAGYADLSWPP